MRAMPGSPLKRQRMLGPAEKIERLFDMSLDDLNRYGEIPWGVPGRAKIYCRDAPPPDP